MSPLKPCRVVCRIAGAHHAVAAGETDPNKRCVCEHCTGECDCDPIVTRPNGKSYVFMDELTDSERRYLIRYRGLTPEQQQELREFAAYLHAKKASASEHP